MHIDRLDADLAWAFFEMDADFFMAVDIDGDGYISTDDLRFFMLMMLDYPFGENDFSFTRGHAQLAVMMLDRGGDGKLSKAEIQTLIDGSYTDDTMTPELSTA
jgi:Ca2+-binding EF-hand superfamily protein